MYFNSLKPELLNQKKKTILFSIIDDEEFIRSIIIRTIKMMNFDDYKLDLIEFESGIQFLESRRLEESGEHLLILDGVMPEMDGMEVLKKVKSDKNRQGIYVLMLTGRKSEPDIKRALTLGADDYLTKPFSITELQARIQRLIKRIK
ncbi:response regulator [Neobacillus sp. WH10]|uniref:response regulator transcription factor n=1 Tax=Neobacillus sp. WH10 TaxID=3047873 RepID=UPI0024C13B24|nr:response regulator [Neobacillus sp. WH10]WHY78831.1 response regulator [Neobacillus sp. WH10]